MVNVNQSSHKEKINKDVPYGVRCQILHPQTNAHLKTKKKWREKKIQNLH